MSAISKNLYDGSSSSVLYTDRRDFYIKPNVVRELYPTVTPFLTFVSNFNTITGFKDPQFKMFQHRNPWVRQYIYVTTGTTTAADNAEDTLAIDSTKSLGLATTFTSALVGLKANIFAAGSDGKPVAPCLGSCLITTFTSATSVNIKNLTSASIVIPNASYLEVIGTEFGEGSEAPNSWADELQVVWNQCGIHRTSFQLTKVLMDAALRGESSEYDRMKLQKSQEHQIQKERNMLFSQSNIGTNLTQTGDTFSDGSRTDVNGNTVRSTYGALQAIIDKGSVDLSDDDQNGFSITEGSYTYSDFVDQTEKSFWYVDDGTQPLFCGNGFMSYWSKMNGAGAAGLSGKSRWTVQLSERKVGRLGFSYRELETPHGIYQLVPTSSMTKSPYNKWAFAPGKDDIFHAIYQSPKYMQNIKTDNNPLYQKNEYISQEGIGLTNLQVHKYFEIA